MPCATGIIPGLVVGSLAPARELAEHGMKSFGSSQLARAVFMVRPVAFGGNPETASSNAFQTPSSGPVAETTQRATAEFDSLVGTLARAGVEVHVGLDSSEPPRPDACFPNNWVSFHDDGAIVLYPLLAPNRRAERRIELLRELVERGQRRVTRIVDLSGWEHRGGYLEGTGSLVLDRQHRVAYACSSARTSPGPLRDFAQLLGFEPFLFDAFDAGGQPMYHTNVMMSVAREFAVVCIDALPSTRQRGTLRARLEVTGHEVLVLDPQQIHEFAGNMLALEAADGRTVLAMSGRARASLTPVQLRFLERRADLVCCDIPTIERVGGGSVRCLLAENFLPRR